MPACGLPCSNSVVPANCGALLALPGDEHMASRSLQSSAQSQAQLPHIQTQDRIWYCWYQVIIIPYIRRSRHSHLVSSKSFLLPKPIAEKAMSILSQGTAQCWSGKNGALAVNLVAAVTIMLHLHYQLAVCCTPQSPTSQTRSGWRIRLTPRINCFSARMHHKLIVGLVGCVLLTLASFKDSAHQGFRPLVCPCAYSSKNGTVMVDSTFWHMLCVWCRLKCLPECAVGLLARGSLYFSVGPTWSTQIDANCIKLLWFTLVPRHHTPLQSLWTLHPARNAWLSKRYCTTLYCTGEYTVLSCTVNTEISKLLKNWRKRKSWLGGRGTKYAQEGLNWKFWNCSFRSPKPFENQQGKVVKPGLTGDDLPPRPSWASATRCYKHLQTRQCWHVSGSATLQHARTVPLTQHKSNKMKYLE